MKKFIIALVMLASCTSKTTVMLNDGKIISLESPDITLNKGDSVVIKESLHTLYSNYNFYGMYVGKLPDNPEPCHSMRMSDSSTVFMCTFYLVGIVK